MSFLNRIIRKINRVVNTKSLRLFFLTLIVVIIGGVLVIIRFRLPFIKERGTGISFIDEIVYHHLNRYVSLELAYLILIVGIIGGVFVGIISLLLLSKYMKNRRSFDDVKSLVCPNCGAVLIEGKKFCTKCGTKIKNA